MSFIKSNLFILICLVAFAGSAMGSGLWGTPGVDYPCENKKSSDGSKEDKQPKQKEPKTGGSGSGSNGGSIGDKV